jgi:OmpA family/Carboxypeptidase regulatory-like domain/WD40-like Beta Propeller Repeat
MPVSAMRLARLFALISCLVPVFAYAQQGLLHKADKLYAQYSFAEAITFYERAFDQGAKDNMAAQRLADSYHRLRDLSGSEKWYALLVQWPDATPTDFLRYAEALRANAKYAQADSVMALFAVMDTTDSRGVRLAHNVDLFPKLLVDPVFEGKLVQLPWNSTQLDLSPALWNGKVVFASTRTPQVSVHRTHAWDGHPFLNLYVLNDSTAVPLRGTVNSKFHESDPAFSADGTQMYFTRNNTEALSSKESERPIGNLVIMTSTLVNGIWTAEVPFAHNAPAHSTGHPSLSMDGLTLYFSSDRPGGFGGIDIWKCERDSCGEWKEPVNLGPKVNTEGDEMFPSVHGDHALFFSSDGHPGLGGLDVFLAWDFSIGPSEPENVGAPINSRVDDMSLALTPDGSIGYFSSDRKGGLGGSDIYMVQLDELFKRKVRVHGEVLSKEDHHPLANVPVKLKRPDRSVIMEQLTNKSGEFDFIVMPQAMTLTANIPGGSETELPMDEHLLLLQDEVALGDVQLSTFVDVPITVRMIDKRTGLPAPGVEVLLVDRTHEGRVVAQGITDARGVVQGTLRQVRASQEVQLDLTASAETLPELGVELSFRVQDGLPHVLKHDFDMGERMTASYKTALESTFFFLYDNTVTEGGSVWSGTVLDKNDRTPIAHVRISARDMDHKEVAHTETGLDGRYRIRTAEIVFTIEASIPGGDTVLLEDVSPFGSDELPPIEVNSIMDLPVNAILKDAATDAFLEGVTVTVKDKRDGLLLFTGVTDRNGISQGRIPDRRFGTEQHLEVSLTKEGYLPVVRSMDFVVLVFLEVSLGGLENFLLAREVSKDMIGAEKVWSGKVVDRNDGTPIAHVGISARNAQEQEVAHTVTGTDGSYRIRTYEDVLSIEASIPGGDTVLLENISPAGSEALPFIEVNSIMDLPVNAILKDETTNAFLEGVTVTVKDKRDGLLLFTGVTDRNGISQGQIPDRRFGTEQHLEVSLTKEGYLPVVRSVDFTVLVFLEVALGGLESFAMIPETLGVDVGKAMKLRPILFDYRDAEVREDAAIELEQVLHLMQLDTAIRIELRAHTDQRGGHAYNLQLSQERATNVKTWLVSRGIAAERLIATGVGALEPLFPCPDGRECPEEEMQANRRTEFVVIGCDGCGLLQPMGH